MFICAAGDIHGALDRLYEDVFAFETLLGIRFDLVLHVGDFGIWPDANRIDKATRYHEGAGERVHDRHSGSGRGWYSGGWCRRLLWSLGLLASLGPAPGLCQAALHVGRDRPPWQSRRRRHRADP
jgi:hypothetical protein